MASIISGAGDFKVIPLDSECLLMAEGSRLTRDYERLLWRKPTLKFHFSGAENDPQRTPQHGSEGRTSARSGLLI
jgi:hypothetical protein